MANTDAVGASFTAAAKHLQGNTCYGVESDTTSTFQDPTTHAVGVILAVGTCPVAVAQADDYTGVGNWVAK